MAKILFITLLSCVKQRMHRLCANPLWFHFELSMQTMKPSFQDSKTPFNDIPCFGMGCVITSLSCSDWIQEGREKPGF